MHMYKHTFTHVPPYTYKYTHICTHTCMYAHTSIYTYIFHSMWTSQTPTRYIWETEPGVPDE